MDLLFILMIHSHIQCVLGKHNDGPSRYVESASSSSMISLSQYVSASTVSNEVDHEEEFSHTVLVSQ